MSRRENKSQKDSFVSGKHGGPKVIVALDYPLAKPALDLVARLDPAECRLKIGKQLFTTAGPDLVSTLQNRGFDLFLDLKFHDIPNTVAGACASAVDLGVWMVNVHAAGGARMLEAAREAVPADSNSSTLLIAVTVLTSMTESDLAATGISKPLQQQVGDLALLAHDSGLDGVVCSPQEAAPLRELCGSNFTLVTPGVRPAGSDSADQRRVMSPQEAVACGSNFLVVGRPVTQAPDPLQALQDINKQLESQPI